MSPFLNYLDEREFKVAERLSAWTLTLLGYFVAAALALDSSGWSDPVFNIVRGVPFSMFGWAVTLFVSTFIFNMGYIQRPQFHWRGAVIILGAMMCAVWWLGLSACMSRMVYELPTRITILWPLVTAMIACLYLSRVVVYSDMFTGDRWNTNPYQLWATTGLMMASLSQVVIGISPVSILSEIERPAALTVGGANLFGALVVMFGLHLRDKEQGLMYELAGAFSLAGTLGWYCAAVLHQSPLAGTTLGFVMPEMFVFATFHRGIQILTLQWARRSNRGPLERRMIHALNPTGNKPPPHDQPPPVSLEPEVPEASDG